MRHANEIILWLFVLASILIKIWIIIKVPLYDDASFLFAAVKYFGDTGFNFLNNPHPPMGMWFIILSFFLTKSILGVRLTLLAIHLLILFGMYKFLKAIYNKDLALKSVFLFSLTFFGVYVSLIPDFDCNLMALFSLMLFCFLWRYSQKEGSINLIFAGIFFGCLILTKLRGGLLFFSILAFFLYFLKQKWKKTFTVFCSTALLVFLSFPLMLYLEFPSTWKDLLVWIITHTAPANFSILKKLVDPLIFMNIWIALTPLLIYLIVLNIFNPKNRKDILFYAWLIPPFLLFICFIEKELFIEMPKFISFLIIPICALSARGLAKIKLVSLIKSSILGLLIGSLLFFLNNYKMNDHWFFMTAMGPVIKIGPTILIGIFALITFFFLLYILFPKKMKVCLILFLILSFSLNFFLIGELLFDKTAMKLVNDFKVYSENNTLKLPLFSWNEDIPGYLDRPDINLQLIKNPNLQKIFSQFNFNDQGYIDLDFKESVLEPFLKKGGTVLLYNYPYEYTIQKNKARQQKIKLINEYCIFKKRFEYLPLATGEVYQCP